MQVKQRLRRKDAPQEPEWVDPWLQKAMEDHPDWDHEQLSGALLEELKRVNQLSEFLPSLSNAPPSESTPLHESATTSSTFTMVPKQWRVIRVIETEPRCYYCHSPRDLHDLFIPGAAGGRDEYGNRVPCCDPCHKAKGSNVFKTLREAQEFVLVSRYNEGHSLTKYAKQRLYYYRTRVDRQAYNKAYYAKNKAPLHPGPRGRPRRTKMGDRLRLRMKNLL